MSDHHDELRLYAHSTLLYWWPVWLIGFVLGAATLVWGTPLELQAGEPFNVLAQSGPGLLFAGLIFLTVFVTSVRLKGMRSVVLIMALTIAALLLAWAGIIDDVVALLPGFRAHLSAGFYFTLSGGLFALWALSIFVFDRMSYWRIAEGQLTHVKLVGLAEKSYDARGMTVEHEADDILRHYLFGMGSGDIILRTSGAEKKVIRLQNLLFAGPKITAIQKLVAVEPVEVTTIAPEA